MCNICLRSSLGWPGVGPWTRDDRVVQGVASRPWTRDDRVVQGVASSPPADVY